MDNNTFIVLIRKIFMVTFVLAIVTIGLFSASCYYFLDPELSLLQPKKTVKSVQPIDNSDLIKDGIHVSTGLIANEGVMLVVQNCTSCHSAKMITQNRANKEGWKSMIKWMQQTQNLWDLGANEEKIIAYLASNYAPQKKGRRARLSNIEWYELE